jgi:hypothetical protein
LENKIINVYLKHRPNKYGFTDYWKKIFKDTNKYKVYELTEEDRLDCIPANKDLYNIFGGIFACHMTSFLHSTTNYHWAIDAEDIKFEEKFSHEQILNLLQDVEKYTIDNNLDGMSYDMYMSILGGEDKIGPNGKKFKDHIPHWTFGIAFLKSNNNILDLILRNNFNYPWNADWRMSELKYNNILKLKTFTVPNATVHHTWGDIITFDTYLVHNGDPNNPPSHTVFPIKDEIIKFKL